MFLRRLKIYWKNSSNNGKSILRRRIKTKSCFRGMCRTLSSISERIRSLKNLPKRLSDKGIRVTRPSRVRISMRLLDITRKV